MGEPPEETEVRAALEPALAQTLEAHGFVQAARDDQFTIFERKLDGALQEISYRLIRGSDCEVHFNVWHDAVVAVQQAAIGATPLAAPTLWFPATFFARRYRLPWEIETPDDVRAIVSMLEGKLLALADLCSDLRGLDQVMNDEGMNAVRSAPEFAGQPREFDGSKSLLDVVRFQFDRIVVARLAANPRFAEIAAELDAHYCRDDMWADDRERYRTLRQHLEKVPPVLSRPGQDAYRAALRPLPPSLVEWRTDSAG